ncbi:TrmB family transcriptional regulator [Pantoea alhagi]|uniref:TrmB family transcriptional regulator n=1 Tax=Pantoea alhagi TaxID=1891675 RepID=A0A1W6B240_9GAMM|nr:TrmB family transcriptional regulator [Pantoea alhagi]ARJ41134.1 TrmB family transcriptional regulator [Pantoea alhagi]
MQKQPYMTAEAKAIFNELSNTPATAREIAEIAHLSQARCQFILTQLVMAGLAIYQFGCYKRRQ